MNIRNFLFGKTKLFETAKLGTFKATIRNEKTRKVVVWLCTVAIPGYADEITIILEGDGYAPDPQQIESATRIVESIQRFNKELIASIMSDHGLREKYRSIDLQALRLACLNPWEISLNSYELSFESLTNEAVGVSAIVQEGKIIEID